MKKLVKGKLYDMEKAESVFAWTNGRSVTDFKYRSKELFRTKRGSWFIYHVGGAMTDMAKECGQNSWTGSEDIEVISEEEAFDFMQVFGAINIALHYFGEKIEEA